MLRLTRAFPRGTPWLPAIISAIPVATASGRRHLFSTQSLDQQLLAATAGGIRNLASSAHWPADHVQSSGYHLKIAGLLAAAFAAGSGFNSNSACLCEEVGVSDISGNNPIEDRHAFRNMSPRGVQMLAAAVFDGHGGWQVADWLCTALLPALERHLEAQSELDASGRSGAVQAALEAAFAECDAALRQQLIQLEQQARDGPKGGSSFARALRVGSCARGAFDERLV
ncbi:unnamed protein product [Polarella glacialis]|uniref:PPM-type phosphatase domain-containing protein n=1 Tax=Polarella glacialis TaxID=89957 RepID=A0A813LTW5_POLGL|nr:unnamed protein product [Polarella glacialis]